MSRRLPPGPPPPDPGRRPAARSARPAKRGSAAAQRAASESRRRRSSGHRHPVRVPEHGVVAGGGAHLPMQVAGVRFHQHRARLGHVPQLRPRADVQAAPVGPDLSRGHEQVGPHAVLAQQGPGDARRPSGRRRRWSAPPRARAGAGRAATRSATSSRVITRVPVSRNQARCRSNSACGGGPELAVAQGGHAEQDRAQDPRQVAGLEILAEVVVAEHRNAGPAVVDQGARQVGRVQVVRRRRGGRRGVVVPAAGQSQGGQEQDAKGRRPGCRAAAASEHRPRRDAAAEVRL